MKHTITIVLMIILSLGLASCGKDKGGDKAPAPAPDKMADEKQPEKDMMADSGDNVLVHYVGTFDDGEEFDSSRQDGRSPLGFVVGDGSMIAGFDAAVNGMKVGETKNVRIEAEDAYGSKVVEQEIPKAVVQEIVGEGVEIVAGQDYAPEGKPPLTVVSMDEENVVISFENSHHLAGKALNFEIELLSVNE